MRMSAKSPPRHTGLGRHGLALPRLLAGVQPPRVDGRHPTETVLALDIGGTLVRAALADLAGTVIAERRERTESARTSDLLDQLARMCTDLRTEAAHPPRVAVAGCPAVLDPTTGAAQLSPNVPAIEGGDMLARLEDALGLPVDMENDVNLAAAGERWLGAARGTEDFVLLNIGTGVGAGLVLAGEVYRGRGGTGEVAHLPFGRGGLVPLRTRAAFEDAVSPAGLVARWQERAGTGGDDSRAVVRAAIAGDLAAVAALDEEATLLAYGVASLVSVLDPPLIVLAGGLGADPHLVSLLRARLADSVRPVPLVPTELDGRAGLLGAILLGTGVAHAISQ